MLRTVVELISTRPFIPWVVAATTWNAFTVEMLSKLVSSSSVSPSSAELL